MSYHSVIVTVRIAAVVVVTTSASLLHIVTEIILAPLSVKTRSLGKRLDTVLRPLPVSCEAIPCTMMIRRKSTTNSALAPVLIVDKTSRMEFIGGPHVASSNVADHGRCFCTQQVS